LHAQSGAWFLEIDFPVRANGQDIGYLPQEWAEEIAPRLDAGSPVTATVKAVEPFETEMGRHLHGVRLLMMPHRLKRRPG